MQDPIGVMGGGSPSSAGSASPAGNGSSSGAAGVQSHAPAGSVIPGSTDGSNGSVEDNPVPFSRFKEVNEKLGRLKWAEAYENPDEVSQAVALRRWVGSDLKGFFAYLQSQMEAHGHIPREAPREPQQTPQPPQPDYVDPQTGLKVYSADRANDLVRYHIEQLKGEIDGRVKPVEEFLGTAQVRMRAQSEARGIIANAEKNWPHFSDHKAKIFEAMGKNRNLSLSEAYISVVVPAIGNRERQELLTDLDQKTGATTASPASQQGGGAEDLTKQSWGTLLRREYKKRGMMR